MLSFNRLAVVAGIAVGLGCGSPLGASTRQGDRYLAEGRKHEALREWDAALDLYRQALATDTAEMVYQMAVTKARFQAGAVHQDLGIKLREQGKLEESLAEFQKAQALDPASPVAQQEITRTQEMIQRDRERVAQTGQPSTPAVRGMTPAEEARRDADQRINRILPPLQLHPSNPLPANIKMNGQTARVLFETVGKLAGIKLVWDPEYQGPGQRLNVDLRNATVEQALDSIAVLSRSYWKPLAADTIFITDDTPAKRREYE